MNEINKRMRSFIAEILTVRKEKLEEEVKERIDSILLFERSKKEIVDASKLERISSKNEKLNKKVILWRFSFLQSSISFVSSPFFLNKTKNQI